MLQSFLQWLKSLKVRYKVVIAAVVALFASAEWIDDKILEKAGSKEARRLLVELWQNLNLTVTLPIYVLAIAGAAVLAVLVAGLLAGMFMLERAKQEIVDLTKQLGTDDLTEIPNRRRIREMFTEKLKLLEDSNTPFCLAYLDVVDFKSINQRVHHERADVVLKEFAKLIEGDIHKDDRFFRLSGDQFALLLHRATPSKAVEAANRLNGMLQNHPIPVDVDPDTGHQVSITVQCRFGITDGSAVETLEECLQRADGALKIAKEEQVGSATNAGVRVITKSMALANPRLVAAEPIVSLPKK